MARFLAALIVTPLWDASGIMGTAWTAWVFQLLGAVVTVLLYREMIIVRKGCSGTVPPAAQAHPVLAAGAGAADDGLEAGVSAACMGASRMDAVITVPANTIAVQRGVTNGSGNSDGNNNDDDDDVAAVDEVSLDTVVYLRVQHLAPTVASSDVAGDVVDVAATTQTQTGTDESVAVQVPLLASGSEGCEE